jgi:catechol 2,3-dioxygenase-like lactoylglutathione lyase family enzyme
MPGETLPPPAPLPTRPAPAADVVVAAIPVLRVADAERSVRFYCGRLGFRQDWWHQAGPEEPATVSVSRGGASLHLTERTDVGPDGQVCVSTIDLSTLVVEWGSREDVVLEHGPTPMPWGFTEIAFRDPDGNRIRVAQPTGCQT